MSRFNKRAWDWEENPLHTDVCGICLLKATSVNVYEPWQVGTMHTAGSEELCVILMQPWEKLSKVYKAINNSACVWRCAYWRKRKVLGAYIFCPFQRRPLENSGCAEKQARSNFSGAWGQMRQSYIWWLGWGGETGLKWLILIMYLTLGMGKNSASKTMTWLTFTKHSKQKEVHFPLIEVCQPVEYFACWLLFTLHRDSP